MTTLTVASDWRAHGVCSDVDPDLFFPEPNSPAERVDEAKQICARCPVKQQCLEDAMRRKDTDAICGGLTPEERYGLLCPVDRPARPGVRRPGQTSARQLAVQHGAYLLDCLVQWQMAVEQVAVELGSTPLSVYRAYLMLVPARPGQLRPKKPTRLEELLRTRKEQLRTLARLGRSHEDIAVVLGTSQSYVSAALSILKQRDTALERLADGGSIEDALSRLQDEEIRVRRESGAGATVDDVIQTAGVAILRMHGDGIPLRHVASALGLCRESVRKAYLQMTSKDRGMGEKALTQNEMGAAA
jgi:WhiB family redox-sensing transcriptional regulator